ncbi:hypothetical protein CEE37_14160 [candidate division LCP-89 bacterium B3_LCP]|uniref:Uncharacterized protein n=1 Tax=candidate division LCP-89 bacterium B3_LCP TaxID=2012998 RepID=A0A532UQQ9_UNCL8|nr:MAG: hypothetical protein CEE37_14160 [candidate division LCP-89 bacterium B3_LCP]
MFQSYTRPPGQENGIYLYEIAILLSSSPEVVYAIGTHPGETISLCMEFGGMDREQMKNMINRSEMGGGRGGRGSMGGGMGGKRGGSMHPLMPGMEKVEAWISIDLGEK